MALSVESVSRKLDATNIKYEFINWNILVKLVKKDEDPLRAWTIETDKGRIQINGAGLIRNQKFLIIKE